MYHHIADVRSDPGTLSVSPQHFAEHLDVLQREARPLRLDQLSKNLGRSSVPPRSVVITFDDGYADNLIDAKPLLDRHDTPATVFVTTGAINDRSEFWWDELERLLLLPSALPESLELFIAGKIFRCDIGEASIYSEEACLRFRNWKPWEENPPTLRHSLYSSLCRIIKPMSDEMQQAVMKDLRHWAGTEESGIQAHRRLTPGEIVSLSRGHLIEVGGHTVTHPILSTLARDRQWDEIQQNKFFLEEILEAPVSSFAYPYGDYSRETLRIVREAGFDCACSIIRGAVQPDSDLFQLPRLHIWDMGGDEFAAWLRRMWTIEPAPRISQRLK
jgi:peptidoglycan/xylan/chitin deacetylase (PgdA/CDA1 family)